MTRRILAVGVMFLAVLFVPCHSRSFPGMSRSSSRTRTRPSSRMAFASRTTVVARYSPLPLLNACTTIRKPRRQAVRT